MGRNVRDMDDELKERLTSEQYEVSCGGGTEPPFTGKYWDCKDSGVYRCVCCELELFDSGSKFASGTGWPSFMAPLSETAVTAREDTSHGMRRVEVVCSRCEAHLGHVFPDGPQPTGLRYCINSASLSLAHRET